MRVVDRNPITGASATTNAPRAVGSGSRFSLNGSATTGRASATQSTAPMGAMDGLLTIQATGDSLERRKRAMRRGRNLLDTLDQLKIALLSGRVSPQQLATLKAQLQQKADGVDDPGLADILAHIELRAEVEIAKLARG